MTGAGPGGPLPPTGEQVELVGHGYRAVVTQSGSLRVLEHRPAGGAPRALVDGFAEDAVPTGGRGQLLVPWPNRVAGASYSFGGREHRLPVTEHARGHASHGLVRWATWEVAERAADRVVLRHRLLARPGYPWTLDLETVYALSPDGLRVDQVAVNRSAEGAPYASGAHPWLRAAAGTAPTPAGTADAWRLRVPARTRLLVDELLVPAGREDVGGTSADLRAGCAVAGTVLDHAFTDLDREPDGRAVVDLAGADGSAVRLWVDQEHRWLQVFTGDDGSDRTRCAVAVEPMTSPPDAFGSGEDLRVLAPGERFTATWGIAAG